MVNKKIITYNFIKIFKMKNLIFIACILISFNTIQAQPQCEKMLSDLKDKFNTERPQDFDAAVTISQTFSSNWMLSGCDRKADEFVFISNELQEFVESMRSGGIANDFNFSFDAKKETKEEVNESINEENAEETELENTGFGNQLMEKYAEGGVGFMTCVLICLILGLALCIERIIYLHLASSNSKNLLMKIEESLKSGGVEAAKEECRNTTGPTASICLQGLERSDENLELIEKSIVSYGSVQMGLLEKGTSWISLFIAIAPMLGFMGTVIGMISAFDAIEVAGDISPSLVAGGIKQALLTTVFGLIVAIILQVFYNYIVAKIDDIVNDMENSSISLVDLIANFKKNK
jgi:biopolymer transport protein ExbB